MNITLDNHFNQLVKLILKTDFRIHLHHETNKKLETSTTARLRSHLTKTIPFQN